MLNPNKQHGGMCVLAVMSTVDQMEEQIPQSNATPMA